MWPEFGNFWTERTNTAPTLASIHAMVHEINILLVDHDQEAANIVNDLEMSQYKVTCVGLAQVMSMLASVKFDLMMLNISSPDYHEFGMLMHHATSMCIPVLCMADSDDPHMAMWAIQTGAFICIQRPPSMELLRYLWQYVMREKAKLIKERDLLVSANNRGVEFRDVHVHQRNDNPNPNPNPNSNHIPDMMSRNKGKQKMRSTSGRYNDCGEGYGYGYGYGYDTNTMGRNGNVKRKMCTEWTQELHAKFVDVVRQLGEGRCFPKEILELMNEPGLTRMQVASHLQKCRNDNWRSPEERKSTLPPSMHPSLNDVRTRGKSRRFGSMPLVGKPTPTQTQGKAQDMGQTSETRLEVPTLNDGEKIGNGLMMTQSTHDHYGASSSMNPRHPSDEYFNFPDVDSFMHDFSDKQQDHVINNPNPNPNPDPTQDGYQVHPAHNDGKNSDEKNMKTN